MGAGISVLFCKLLYYDEYFSLPSRISIEKLQNDELDENEYKTANVTIVPTGGLEKVATFISLLRGSKLEMVCLLDFYTDAKGKAKMDTLIQDKIIQKNKIRFFHEYLDGYSKADLEDLFTKSDYLKLFNSAFTEHPNIDESNLNPDVQQILIQINQDLKVPRINHYRPANELVKIGIDKSSLSNETLNNFEKVFVDVNKLFN